MKLLLAVCRSQSSNPGQMIDDDGTSRDATLLREGGFVRLVIEIRDHSLVHPQHCCRASLLGAFCDWPDMHWPGRYFPQNPLPPFTAHCIY